MTRPTSTLSKTVVVNDWRSLIYGDYVTVRQDGADVGAGWVDQVTDDGSIVWLHLVHGGGRRMYLRADRCALTAEIVSSSV